MQSLNNEEQSPAGDSVTSIQLAVVEDDIFAIDAATPCTFRPGANADKETATFLFKSTRYDEKRVASAEEILRKQRLGRSPRTHPNQKLFVPKLVLEENSPISTSSLTFERDGGFSAQGFKITENGLVSTPNFDLREDNIDSPRGIALSPAFKMKALSEFQRGPTIGAGAGGKVYLALHKPTSTAIAMKTVNVFDKGMRHQLMKELLTLSQHVSPYLVRFYGAFYDGEGAVHIALEFMDRGCLASFVRKNGALPEHAVRVIALDCARGLRFLHKHHVLHRDLKSANILLSREKSCAKISDFGLARDLAAGVSVANTFVGTTAYMSPERLQNNEYKYASDIWALGVSLCECLIGKYPFGSTAQFFDHVDEITNASVFESAHPDIRNSLSENAVSFVELCASTDPELRPVAFELLEHPWLKDFQADRVMFGAWVDEVSGKENVSTAF